MKARVAEALARAEKAEATVERWRAVVEAATDWAATFSGPEDVVTRARCASGIVGAVNALKKAKGAS